MVMIMTDRRIFIISSIGKMKLMIGNKEVNIVIMNNIIILCEFFILFTSYVNFPVSLLHIYLHQFHYYNFHYLFVLN